MYLLDTNVISELRSGKQKQSHAVRAWAQQLPANQLYLSSISVLELEIGVRRIERKDVRQGNVLRAWADKVMQQFKGQVLPFTGETALHCAGMHVPDQRSFRDSMIAAMALEHSLILATRNAADFEGLRIEMVNPWNHAN